MPMMIDTGRLFRAGDSSLANLAAAWPHAARLAASGRIPDCAQPFSQGMRETSIEDLTRPDRILAAMHECENNVRWKASVQRFEIDTLRWAAGIRNDMQRGTYKAMGFKRFDIVERGKLRHIQAVHIRDRTVQKLVCQHALKPEIYPRLIYDNSASQEGKGTEFALERLVEHLRWHLARYGKTGVVVVMDYHGFFDSIPHDRAIQALHAHQGDPLVRKYIGDMIGAFDGSRGLGLGSEISQIAAALYPTPVDRLVKDELGVHCFARYNDDSCLIHQDRRYAEHCLKRITAKAAELGLEVHLAKTRIHNLATDDFTFLKKRVHITDTGRIIFRLTRANIRREESRIRDQRAEYDAGRMKLAAVLQSYQCWRSYAKKYNAYGAVGNMDKYFTAVMGDALRREYPGQRIDYGHPPGGDYGLPESELSGADVVHHQVGTEKLEGPRL